MKKDAKEFLIGRYQLGWRMVNLYAMPNLTGGWYNMCLDGREAEIHVGMDYSDPAEAFAVLCHEVWEMAMNEAGCAFKPQAFIENASDICRFFFNHNQHTEITARASFFTFMCFDAFKAAHAQCRKEPKKARKKDSK